MFAEGAGRTRHLTQKEADRLLTACNPDFRVVVLVALHTGFRKSDLQSLKWLNVDLINRSITVESCYSKNGRARAVPMTKDVFKVLKQLQSERDRSPEDFVLINRYGQPWSLWRTAFVNAVERCWTERLQVSRPAALLWLLVGYERDDGHRTDGIDGTLYPQDDGPIFAPVDGPQAPGSGPAPVLRHHRKPDGVPTNLPIGESGESGRFC